MDEVRLFSDPFVFQILTFATQPALKWYSQYRFYLSLVGLRTIGTLAGISSYGPVASHGLLSRDLQMIKDERRCLRFKLSQERMFHIFPHPAVCHPSVLGETLTTLTLPCHTQKSSDPQTLNLPNPAQDLPPSLRWKLSGPADPMFQTVRLWSTHRPTRHTFQTLHQSQRALAITL